MAIDYSFLEEVTSMDTSSDSIGMANIFFKTDANCYLWFDLEYTGIELKANDEPKMVELPIGEHKLEFMAVEDPNIKITREVDWIKEGFRDLIIVTGLANAIAEAKQKKKVRPTPPPLPGSNAQNVNLPQMNNWNALEALNKTYAQKMPPLPKVPSKK